MSASQAVNSSATPGKMPVLPVPGAIKPVPRQLPTPQPIQSEGRSSPTLANKSITPLPKTPAAAPSQELLTACQTGALPPFIAAFPPEKQKQLEEIGFSYVIEAAKNNQLKLLQWLIQKAPALLNKKEFKEAMTPTFALNIGEKADPKIIEFVLQNIDEDASREDPEGYCFEKLIEARKEGITEDQVIYLIKIGELYFKKKSWAQSLKLLNGALSVLLQDHSNATSLEEYLFSRLGEAENQFFVAKKLQLPSDRIQTMKSIRQALKQIRNDSKEAIEKKVSIQEVQGTFTTKFMAILAKLIDDAQKIVGKPPEAWACFAMGSAGRDEMCPRSDIECAFVVKEGKPNTLEYFRQMAEILEIWIINCGETPYPIFGRIDPFHPSPTPGGFAFDSAGNTPLGVKGVYELIGTPKTLAQFISLNWMERNIILPNALSAVRRVAGDEKLVDEYNKEKEKALESRGKKEPKIREILAYRLLEGHLQEFRPDLSQEKAKGHVFGIKKELYRPFQEILGCLALIFKLKEKNTFKRIDELVQQKKITSKGGENLKRAIELVLTLRVEAHLFYGDEQEYICHREYGKWHEKGNTFAMEQMLTTNPALRAILPHSAQRASVFKNPQMRYFLYFDPPKVAVVEQIYRVLMPFHRCAEEFFHTKNPAVLASQDFCDEEMLVRAFLLEKSFQLQEAMQLYQQVVALNPNDPRGLISLSRVEAQLGKPREALGKAKQANEILEKQCGYRHPYVAQSLDHIGDIYYELGEYASALECYTKALQYWLGICDGEEPLYLAKRYNNIAACQHHLHKYEDSLKSNEKALKLRKGAFGEEHETVAQSYHALGCDYKELGKDDKALEYFQKAYQIALATEGSQSLQVATISSSFGIYFEKIGQYQKAFQ
ncbi:MAG: tetratricopeptide repeat protein, partial [Parachlamydia sp.]|nr:tetratricopeptide repeat protein [Parachlamydia sp.]